VGLFTIGYQQRRPLPTAGLVCLPVFAAALVLVPLAWSVTTFLFVWELMALTSTVLLLAEHRHEPVRRAGQLYAVMTQLGFALLLIGLVVGLMAGLFGGWIDTLLSRAGDVLLAVPQILIAVGVVAACSTNKNGCLARADPTGAHRRDRRHHPSHVDARPEAQHGPHRGRGARRHRRCGHGQD